MSKSPARSISSGSHAVKPLLPRCATRGANDDPGDVLRWPGKWDRRAELRTLVGTARRTIRGRARRHGASWRAEPRPRRSDGERSRGSGLGRLRTLPSGEAATRRIRQHQRPVGSVLHRLRARTAASVLRSEAAERCVAQSGSMPTSGRDHRHRLQRSGPDSCHSVGRSSSEKSQRSHNELISPLAREFSMALMRSMLYTRVATSGGPPISAV